MRYCLAPPQQRLLRTSPNFSTYWTAKINVIAVMVAGMTGLVGTFVAWEERGRKFGQALERDLKEKILKSTILPEYKKLSPYIKRRGLPDIVKIFAAMEKQKTVVVCGPQGCGKTAAVHDSLLGEGMVIVVTVSGEDNFDQKIAYAITESLGLATYSDVNHTKLVVNTLNSIKKTKMFKRPPILVVDTNQRFTSKKVLKKLLLVLKDWGYEKGLVSPVVVLSTSQAVLMLKPNKDELRTQFVSIGDLHEYETEFYIEKLCIKLNLGGIDGRASFSKCIEKVVNTIGCRLLHLEVLANNINSVRLLKSTSELVTLKNLEYEAEKYGNTQLNDSRRAWQELYKVFPKEKINEHFFKKPGAAVDMYDFCASVGVDLNIFLDELFEIQPQPLYVDPITRTVTVGSVFFQKVMDEDDTANS